jgi:hypothetical protein
MAGAPRTGLALVLLVVAAGCGGEDGSGTTSRETADPAARAPHGWRTVRNEVAGFTLSVPRGWTVRLKRRATLIRSKDRLLVLTVAADRSEQSRKIAPREYARRTVDQLPDFEGSVLPRRRRVSGSPYRSARVDGAGSLRTSKRPQRITVAVYKRPGVTYAIVAFANLKTPAGRYGPRLRRILGSLRGQPAQLG